MAFSKDYSQTREWSSATRDSIEEQ